MKQRLIFIGNSIVAGYPWGKSKSFTSALHQILKGESGDTCCRPDFAKNTGFEIINKGVNGDSTAGILKRFKCDVLDYQPDMVFILTGTNDFIYRDASPQEAFENLRLMSSLAENDGIKPILITPLLVDAGKAEFMWMAGCGISYPAVNRDVDNLSELIRQSGISFVDFNRAYPHFIDSVGDADMAFLDGLHPTPEGHRFLAGQLVDFLSAEANKLDLK